MKQRSRRAFLGALATSGLVTVAGCSGDTPSTATTVSDTEPSPTASEATETPSETATPGTRTVEDMVGRTVELPATVDSVVGLGSGGLRLLTYADATDEVVGVEQLETSNEKRPFRPYVHANPSLTDLPSIGSRKSPDAELLLQQDPDVIVWAWAKSGEAADLQTRLDIPVVVIQPGDLDPNNRPLFFDSLSLLGEVLGDPHEDATADIRSYTESLMADLSDRTSDVPESDRPSAYVGYLGRGKHGFPYTQPLYPPMNMVNADNVMSDVTEDLKKKKGAARVTVDPESIIERDPSYVFVDVGTEEYDALSQPEYESITAIENGDVYSVFPTRDYSINFETVLTNAYYVGSVLYPDRFDDVEPVAKADEIYERFVGAPVYEDVSESYGWGYGRMEI